MCYILYGFALDYMLYMLQKARFGTPGMCLGDCKVTADVMSVLLLTITLYNNDNKKGSHSNREGKINKG